MQPAPQRFDSVFKVGCTWGGPCVGSIPTCNFCMEAKIMAERGKPLPFAKRNDIKAMAENKMPIKVIARALDVSKNTVKKYK